jgi:hypothetical protein
MEAYHHLKCFDWPTKQGSQRWPLQITTLYRVFPTPLQPEQNWELKSFPA